MSNIEISDTELAKIFRAKASKYKMLADMLEGNTSGFSGFAKGTVVRHVSSQDRPDIERSSPSENVLNAQAIKDWMMKSRRSYRASGLASEMGVSEEDIKAIIDNPESGLTDKERGWIKIIQ